MYKLTDFKKSQVVFVELTGNASRHKNRSELIEEWEVTSVGKKYVTAKKKDSGYKLKFCETDCNYGGLPQKTEYCVDYVLYPSKEDINNKLEKEDLVEWFKSQFSGWNSNSKYSLDKLRKAKEILIADET